MAVNSPGFKVDLLLVNLRLSLGCGQLIGLVCSLAKGISQADPLVMDGWEFRWVLFDGLGFEGPTDEFEWLRRQRSSFHHLPGNF